LAASKKKLAGDVEEQIESDKNNDEVQATQQQHLELTKENTEANR
jgi:protein EARLY FLOWERING 3